jgi:hypothetical protein
VGPLPTRRGGVGGCDEARRRSSRCGCFARELGGERALAEGFGLEPVLFLESRDCQWEGQRGRSSRLTIRRATSGVDADAEVVSDRPLGP